MIGNRRISTMTHPLFNLNYVFFLLGYGWVRQIRVQNNSCSIYNPNIGIDFCDSDLGLFNGENADYGFGWTSYNDSYVPPNGMQNIYKAFQYQSSTELDGELIMYRLYTTI